MSEQERCPQCVERRWDESRTWYNKLARTLLLSPAQFLMSTIVATLIAELIARKGFFWDLYFLVMVPVGIYDLAMFSSWFRRSVIGRYYYLFKDRDGVRHMHRRKPEYEYAPDWVPTFNQAPLSSGLLRLKLGGLFRSNAVLHCKSGGWKQDCERCWSADGGSDGRIRVADNAHTHLFGEHGGRIEGDPDYILDFIDCFPTVQAALDDRQRHESTFDFVHRDLEALIEEIRADRQGLGRSKHAQYTRESISRTLRAACYMLHGDVHERLSAGILKAQRRAGYNNTVLESILHDVYKRDDAARTMSTTELVTPSTSK